MANYANISFEENTGRSSSVSVRLRSTATDPNIITFINACKAVTLGKVRSASKSLGVALFTPDTGAPPTDAQRGQKWLVRGSGADGDNYNLTIPTADPADIATPGGDFMDITTTSSDGETLVNALETIWADEGDGAMTVNSIEYRNYTMQ